MVGNFDNVCLKKNLSISGHEKKIYVLRGCLIYTIK